MGLESGTYIDSLNSSNPVGATDPKSQGDDHIRLIKSTILASFPNIAGAMNASHTELNVLVGATGTAGGDDKIDALPAGTLMLFQQTAAPTGWTKGATHNNKGLRVVTGAVGSGGTDTWTTTFSAAKTTASHTLTTAEIPAHSHNIYTDAGSGALDVSGGDTHGGVAAGGTSQGLTRVAGLGGGHTHDMTMDLQYVDVIIADKD